MRKPTKGLRLDQLSQTQDAVRGVPGSSHLGLGEHDRALALIEQSYQNGGWQVRMLPVETIFDSLRWDTRFRALVEKVR